MGWNINGVLILALSVLLYHYLTLHRELALIQNSIDSAAPASPRTAEPENENKPDPLTVLRNGSSLWCRGERLNRRLCRFRSLCVLPSKQEFVFLHGPDTVVSGLEVTEDKRAVVDLSSVENHNALQMLPTDVLASKVGELHPSIVMVDEPTLLLYRFKPDNLMHVVHDDLLPLFHTLMEVTTTTTSSSGSEVRVAFVDTWPEGPLSPLYALFTSHPPTSLDSYDENTLVCFKDAYAGLNRHTLWYQYGFQAAQGPLENITVTAIEIRRFTDFLTRNLPQILPSSCGAAKIAVFLSRKTTRMVVNEDEVVDAIARETSLPVEVLSLDDTSLVDLIGHIRCADILVGMHGALLVLSMFLKPGSIFVELYPYAIPPEEYTPYKTLVGLSGMGIIYRSWTNERASNSITHPDWPDRLGGIAHLPLDEQERIEAQARVPPHLCCSDPAWLFRIYQDTVVDVDSFLATLREALDEKATFSAQNFGETLQRLAHGTIFPGKVENLACAPLRKKTGLNLSWQPPLNVEALEESSEVSYEVWVQPADQDDYKIFATNKTQQVVRSLSPDTHVNIWVRSKLNDAKFGAFSWVSCKVESHKNSIDISY